MTRVRFVTEFVGACWRTTVERYDNGLWTKINEVYGQTPVSCVIMAEAATRRDLQAVKETVK